MTHLNTIEETEDNVGSQKDTRNLVDKYKNLPVSDIKSKMKSQAFELHIAIENLQHDINIGSIVRSANAFNAGGVHIIGKKHWNRRGAMATEKYLELYHHKTPLELAASAQQNGLIIIGVDNIQNAVNLSDFTMPKNALLVFGQEGPGLSPEMISQCKTVVQIEQFGSTRSINVAAAAAITMYAWVQRHKL
jgi:tRNA G18 (ribose-2'-O)-methylase SpoU